MKILITESQYSELKEIYYSEGTLDRFPLSDAIDVVKSIGFKDFYKFLESYVEKNYNIDLDEIDGSKKRIKNYLEDISNSWQSKEFKTKIKNNKLKFLNDYKVISHIIYKFFKKSMPIYEFGDVKFFKWKEPSSVNFWFFDSSEKTFLGVIKGQYLDQTLEVPRIIKKLGKKAFVVSLSSLKPDMKGQGYGKLMYLAVLDHCESILSDKNLYPESRNIWIHALPRYSKNAGYITNDYDFYTIDDPDEIKHGSSDIHRFFATNRNLKNVY